MNREIKFRVWNTFNERMIYELHRFRPTTEHESQTATDKRYKAPFQYYEDWRDDEDGNARPCHVMQYTGLKDKNGQDVYEEDLIEDKDGDFWVVKWYNNEACFVFQNPYQASNFNTLTWLSDNKIIELVSGELKDCVVVGNTYQSDKSF